MMDAQQRGFTLIELIITVAGVGILAAIAYPSYMQYIVRAKRSSALNFILGVASKQEQYNLNDHIAGFYDRTYRSQQQLCNYDCSRQHGYPAHAHHHSRPDGNAARPMGWRCAQSGINPEINAVNFGRRNGVQTPLRRCQSVVVGDLDFHHTADAPAA